MKANYRTLVEDFLSQRHIAIAGYSTTSNAPANVIYKRFLDNGYQVYAINPKAHDSNDDRCYTNLSSVPASIEGVVIAAPPEAAVGIVEDCIALGIPRIWMHRSIDAGSYDAKAEEMAKNHGLVCISGGCPLMFLRPDFIHRTLIKFIAKTRGVLTASVDPASVKQADCCGHFTQDYVQLQSK